MSNRYRVKATEEAAKHLRHTVSRFIAKRATPHDVEAAFLAFRRRSSVADTPYHRAKATEEAAKHLKLTLSRFFANRATNNEVNAAFLALRAAIAHLKKAR